MNAVSRPLAIARSHADAGVGALLVVTVVDGEWAVHRVAGAAASSSGMLLRGSVDTVLDGFAPLLAGIDLVVLDVADADRGRALRRLANVVGSVRLVVVDPVRLAQFGDHRPLPVLTPLIPAFPRRPVRRWPAALAVGALAVGFGGVATVSRAGSESPPGTVVVGGVRIEVPHGWRHADLASDPAPRLAVVDADTGSRIVLAVSPLRAGATVESVAASLAERIRQRGDDAVSDFAARADFAGRVVTAYRETPDSGAPIRWYVSVVDVEDVGRRQVSVGCQDSGAAALEEACRRAVASLAD
ncbi:MAG: type VII secretion-associated protein [Gordonia sp. (in: high G+C Gram-positive bacteria)]|uniref:type VII secretion-associated protein n=1 Tax=Gordonia sp. (in: high G+C Gram-positive bacteria) TaxID=84139 RepID=UPI0039E56B3A